MPARRPHPALRPYVETIVGYRETLDPAAVHHGLPAPALTVVLSFDRPLAVGWLGAQDRTAYWTCASGLHTGPALIHTHGELHGIQLALTPLGSRALLGVPAAELTGQLASHEDLPLGVDDGTLEVLAAEPDWGRRFGLLERHLLDLVAAHEPAPPAPEVAEAWRLVLATHGRVRVQALSEHVGWGRRRLLSAFSGEIGLGPKAAARVARFDHSRALVERGRSLADAAYAGGYADQAHLAREWMSLAGRTPTELRRSPYYLA